MSKEYNSVLSIPTVLRPIILSAHLADTNMFVKPKYCRYIGQSIVYIYSFGLGCSAIVWG